MGAETLFVMFPGTAPWNANHRLIFTPPTYTPNQPFSICFYLLKPWVLQRTPKVSSVKTFQGLFLHFGRIKSTNFEWSWSVSNLLSSGFHDAQFEFTSWRIPSKSLQICEQLGVHTRCGPERTLRRWLTHQTWSCVGHNVRMKEKVVKWYYGIWKGLKIR